MFIEQVSQGRRVHFPRVYALADRLQKALVRLGDLVDVEEHRVEIFSRNDGVRCGRCC